MKSALLVVEACGYGLARHVVELGTGLLERGWRVGLVYSTTRKTDLMLDSALLRLRSERNFRAYPCAMSLWPSLRDIGVVQEILRAISECHAEILHCHSVKAGFVGRIAAALAGIPSVYTPHAPLCMSPSIPFVVRVSSAWYEALFGRLGDSFIAVSAAERTCALNMGVPQQRIRLVPNGIPIQPLPTGDFRAQIRRRFGISPETVCVGFVGRLAAQKAVDNLLRAWKILHSRGEGSTLTLLIIGDGPLRAEMETLSHDLGLENDVIWAGEAPGLEAMAAFDLFVLPSDYEGMPYVLLEAMAVGLPIVTTDIGGARVLVDDGVNGRIVPARAPEPLALALEEIAGSAAVRKTMGAASRVRVAEFSLDRMIDGVVEVYDALLSSQRDRLERLAAG